MATSTAEPKTFSIFWGYAGVIFAVLIWSGWIIATRDSVTRNLLPIDISILRYGVPALFLAPIWLKKGLFPKGESPLLLAIMTIGWGGPFVYLISSGLLHVPAYLFGPLVPGLLPMVVTAFGVLILKEQVNGMRWTGLAFIGAAVAFVIVPSLMIGDIDIMAGAPWLVTASCGWAAFTIAYRYTSLTGVEAAAYVCLYSLPLLALGAYIDGAQIQTLPMGELLWQGFIQGILSGIGSVIGYAYAVRSLGLPRASAFTSLVPPLAAVGGWLILGEAVSVTGWASVICACLGVYLVNRAVAKGGV